MISENGVTVVSTTEFSDEPKTSGWGGRRPGAGRKPKLIKTIQNYTSPDDANYAVQLVASLMRDETQPSTLRFDAAREILNWALGKPKGAVELGGRDSSNLFLEALMTLNKPSGNGQRAS